MESREGKVAAVYLVGKNETKIEVNGGPSASNVVETMELVWTIDSVEGDKAKITQTVRKMSIVMDTAVGSTRYDTSDKGNPPDDPAGHTLRENSRRARRVENGARNDAQGKVSDVSPDEKTVLALTGNARQTSANRAQARIY